MEIADSHSLTPQPVSRSITVDLREVIQTFDNYYAQEDKLNEPHYSYGKMVEKEATHNHTDILKTVIYMLADDIKSNYADTSAPVDRLTKALTAIVDSLPPTSRNIEHNKRLVSKLIGYFLTLHGMHI
jgi:hypothetical protein